MAKCMSVGHKNSNAILKILDFFSAATELRPHQIREIMQKFPDHIFPPFFSCPLSTIHIRLNIATTYQDYISPQMIKINKII